MKITSLSSLLVVFLLLTFIACKDDDAPSNPAPVFTITSPTDAQIEAGFVRGQNVEITGTVTDNSLVDNIETEIYYSGINTNQGETIEVGQQTATVNYSVAIPTSAPAGEYRIVLIATDDEGASSSWDRTFQVR